MVKITKLILFLMVFHKYFYPVSDCDPDQEPRVTDPDLAKSFESLQIRIHNTGHSGFTRTYK
jgi:hypothetical protein